MRQVQSVGISVSSSLSVENAVGTQLAGGATSLHVRNGLPFRAARGGQHVKEAELLRLRFEVADRRRFRKLRRLGVDVILRLISNDDVERAVVGDRQANVSGSLEGCSFDKRLRFQRQRIPFEMQRK